MPLVFGQGLQQRTSHDHLLRVDDRFRKLFILLLPPRLWVAPSHPNAVAAQLCCRPATTLAWKHVRACELSCDFAFGNNECCCGCHSVCNIDPHRSKNTPPCHTLIAHISALLPCHRYILYYICPLHTFYFLCTYAVMFIARQVSRLASPPSRTSCFTADCCSIVKDCLTNRPLQTHC